MNERRAFLLLFGGGIAMLGVWKWFKGEDALAETGGTFEVAKSDDEWRRILSPQAYKVLRRHGTERPHTSPLNREKRTGTFVCAGCELPLFSSETKFESGTGWPSFYQPLPEAVGTKQDTSYFMVRTEVHCRRCGGHLGHVFEDGPKPTGLRYCMNGVSLRFKLSDASPA